MKENKKHGIAQKRVLTIIAALVVIVVLGVLGFVGNFLVDYAIGRSGDGGNRQVALKVDDEAVAKTKAARTENAGTQTDLTKAFYESVPEETVTIRSDDGLLLSAGLYAQPDESHRWAIVVHGYRGNHYGMLNYAQRYHAAGYQVLAPDLRACGQSEGDYVGMGWPDRIDMLRWIDWILARDPDAAIVMHGVSMGAATVMMTSGEQVPAAVHAFVEDCGYTSVWDIFSSELGLRFGLPSFPVLNIASTISGFRAGYTFTEASSLSQVAKCDRPMMFIHGDQDNFVPYSMLAPLYEAKPGEKRVLSVEGAGHGMASSTLGQQYWDEVFNFLADCGM